MSQDCQQTRTDAQWSGTIGLTRSGHWSILKAMNDQGTEDVKAKFREALERKNKAAQDTGNDARHGESVHGETDTHAHGGKRQFRRKSG